MSRVLLIGDLHLRDRAPRNRSDDYLEEVLGLLWQTVELEKSLECDAVVWAGDVFDHKQPARTSHRTVLKALEVVKAYRNLWIVTGNHDISNDRLETVHEQQPLGVLLAAGAQELVGWHPELPIYGVPWQQRWHAEGTVEDAFKKWEIGRNGDYGTGYNSRCLAVTHAPIFPPELAREQVFELVPAEQIAKAMHGEGALYYGHIHDDHDFFEVDGVWFGNVGAISRGSLTESNLERAVSVAIWDNSDCVPYFDRIALDARPANEIFRVQEVAATKQQKLELNDFLAHVGSTTLSISSTASVVDHIRALDVEESVKRKAIELVELNS